MAFTDSDPPCYRVGAIDVGRGRVIALFAPDRRADYLVSDASMPLPRARMTAGTGGRATGA